MVGGHTAWPMPERSERTGGIGAAVAREFAKAGSDVAITWRSKEADAKALAAEIERVKAIHGVAILYDCHSIRSLISFLFEGRLPDFNVGTDMGRTCAKAIETATYEACASAEGYPSILNGRFKGGWTTRHYGKPETGVHAIQMELAQISHLAAEIPPFDLDEAKAARLRIALKDILNRIEALASTLSR